VGSHAEVGERSAEAGDPEGDGVVDEDGGGYVCRGCAIENQRAGEARVQRSYPAGGGEGVGEIADVVGEHERRDGDGLACGGPGPIVAHPGREHSVSGSLPVAGCGRPSLWRRH
jgi:hypothetical protein